MSQILLDERALKILHHLVGTYIQNGQPVGSKMLSERSQLKLSPATVRHIMADLESVGLLFSPHKSAGRVPTAQAYRLFADHLLTTQLPKVVSLDDCREEFLIDTNEASLIEHASALLSKITHLVGVVTLPKCEQLMLRQVEFLHLSEKRVLVILILDNDVVENRVIETDRGFTRSALEEAGRYLTERFAGQNLLQAREDLLRQVQNERDDLEMMLKTMMEIAEKVQAKDGEYVLSGEANLFNAVNSDEYPQLRSLFEAFSKRRDILHLLDRSLGTQGIQIFIGKELGHSLLEDYSLVTSSYSVNENIVGVLGVIGPRRMPYSRVISAVDVTSRLLGEFLEESL